MSKWSIRHPSLLIFLCVILTAAGIISYFTMERQENPTIESPLATVTCVYPGASPEDIEKEIIKVIEDELLGMTEIKTLEGFCLDSVGIVMLELNDMSDAAIESTWDDVKDRVRSIEGDLPSAAYTPVVKTDFASAYGLILGIASDEYDYTALHQVADELADELEKDPDVKDVDVSGEVKQQVEIIFDLIRLQNYGISATDISNALTYGNVNIPGGNLDLSGVKVPVEISGEYASLEDIENVIVSVSSESGAPVHLKDIATITVNYEKPDRLAFVNGHSGQLICVKYKDGVNILRAEARLQKTVAEFTENTLYADMSLTELYNQADFVDSSIQLFMGNFISAILLVVIVVLAAMGFKSALAVSLPIPLVVFITFAYMKLNAIPIHQVSIVALMICLSLLIANGIVSNDNIYVFLQNGSDPETACTQGVDEVKIPILTSTLTTIASFLPLAMMQGPPGKFVHTLPILVTVALFASYVTSLTVIPAADYRLLHTTTELLDRHPRTHPRLEALKKAGAERFEVLLEWVLRHPKPILLGSIALLPVTLCLVPFMQIQIFPPLEREQYTMNITAPDGSSVERTAELCQEVSDVLSREDSIESFSYIVGDGYPKYYCTFRSNQQASNKAEFLINGTKSMRNQVEQHINQEVPAAVTNVKELEITIPQDYPIQARISGSDLSELRRIAEEVKEIVETVEGTRNVEDNFGSNSYKLKVNLNDEKVGMTGLNHYSIASTVRLVVNGLEVSHLKQADIEKDALAIVARVAEEETASRDVLDTVFITSPITGANVPLSQLADITTESTLNKIVRRGGERTITVGAFVQEGYNTGHVLRSVMGALADYPLPEGYTLTYGGENESREETLGSLKIPALIAALLIYLIIAFQFGNLMEPLLVMLTIPLSFTGVIVGLKIMNYPLGFMALLGAISLMGVVVNNGIVLLDYMKLVYRQSGDSREAAVEACRVRIRPIMVGMVTTVISLLPLMITGGTLWSPLSTAIVFGMIVSSVLTMTVIPCAFILVKKKE